MLLVLPHPPKPQNFSSSCSAVSLQFLFRFFSVSLQFSLQALPDATRRSQDTPRWTHPDQPRGFTPELESAMAAPEEVIVRDRTEMEAAGRGELIGSLIIGGCPGKHLFGHCLVQSVCAW